MSLTPSQGSKQPLAPRPKPKPTVASSAADELESTIARFQAILTDSDREKLQDLKRAQHDIQSIITFTADLDRLDPKRRGKSVASRLASFLQTIEQFTSIVDTYVQSNPNLAALIWGSIKLTFLVYTYIKHPVICAKSRQLLANITSYFLPFVELLGGFGTLCARFAEYKLVFADSQRLKDSICHFHSAVILCCERIVVAIRRPCESSYSVDPKLGWLTQKQVKLQAWNILTQSFQSEIRSYVEDIKSKAETVRDEIQLAKMKSDNLEQHRQAREREAAAESQRQHRLLKAVSSYNYTTAFNTARNKRHNGTAEWAFDTPEFRGWYESDQWAVLHITGKIGSGKSILVSRIIEYICQAKRPGQFVSFLLCRFDDNTSLKADAILRSLVQQILSAITVETIEPVLYAELIKTLEQTKDNFFPREGLQKLYEHASKVFNSWFIVLDGLDECHRDEQQTVYDFFSQVLTKCLAPRRIKILLSCRQTALTVIDRSFSYVYRVFTGSDQTSKDIMVYAKDIIEAKQSTEELVIGDKDLVDEILRAIASREQGMFLWVFLTIEDICCQKSDKAIREALDNIPVDLPAVFDRVLHRIVQNHHQLIARDIFMWTLAAREPLTLAQLREALSVKVGQKGLSNDDLINGIENIAIWCQSLVQVEQADNTVHFSHHSVQEHLLKVDNECMEPFHLDPSKSDDSIAKICLAYLNLSNFKTALVETRSQQPESSSKVRVALRDVPGQTIRAVVESTVGTKMVRFAGRTVGSELPSAGLGPKDLLITKLGTVPNSSAQPKFMEHPFFEYAARNWYCHNLIFNMHDDSNTGGHDDLNFNKSKDETLLNLDGILMEPHPAVTLPWTNQVWLDSLHKQFPHGHDEFPSLDNLLQRLKNRHSQKAHLPFVVVYGHLGNNLAMAHLAFLNLTTPVADEQTLQSLLCVLCKVVKKPVYLSLCVQMARALLGHQSLIDMAIECIADGIEFWPASPRVAVDICDCDTSRSQALIYDDIHMLLKVGYKAKDQPYFKSLARLALRRKSQLASNETLARWKNDNDILLAPIGLRVDAAKEPSSAGSALQRTFSNLFGKKEAKTLRLTAEEQLVIKEILWALDRGQTAQAKMLVTIWDAENEKQVNKTSRSVISLAIEGAAAKWWSTDVAAHIVLDYLSPAPIGGWGFWVEHLSEAIEMERWVLAKKLATSATWMSISEWHPWGEELNFIVEILRCESCRVIEEDLSLQKPEELIFCEKHLNTREWGGSEASEDSDSADPLTFGEAPSGYELKRTFALKADEDT